MWQGVDRTVSRVDAGVATPAEAAAGGSHVEIGLQKQRQEVMEGGKCLQIDWLGSSTTIRGRTQQTQGKL
jgi:hypothetical protein